MQESTTDKNINTGQICFLQAISLISCLAVLLCTWSSSPLGDHGKALWSGPHSFVGDPQHCIPQCNDPRGEPGPILISVTSCCPLSPLQTVLTAGRQSSGRPQVSSTWWGAALTTWPGSLGQFTATQNQQQCKGDNGISYNITSSALLP